MSTSADTPPGKGKPNDIEFLSSDDNFNQLSCIKNWRKMLSNFYIYPIKIEGLTFNTVEHYYQGSKFRLNNYAYYSTFTLESQSPWSEDPKQAKKMGGKHFLKHMKKYPEYLSKFNNVQVDDDFFSIRHGSEMEKALYSKFSKDGLPKTVLLETKDSELYHGTRGVPITRQYILERVRIKIGCLEQ